MKTLQTFRLKPNPAGKDKNKYGGATQAQLGAEWIDIKNIGTSPVALEGVALDHVAFVNGRADHWERIITFNGTLQPGQIMRVHGGSGPANVLYDEDLRGPDHHIFRQRDTYVWNNAEGDTARITEKINGNDVETDKVGYDPYPAEGVVYVRSSGALVPGRLAA